jgi:protease I
MKTLIIFTLFVSSMAHAHNPKKILMIINEGFQVDEYFTPKAAFEKAGFKITTASRYGGLVKPGKKYESPQNTVQTDLSFQEIKVEEYDAISFTGGGGAWSDYFPNPTLHKVLMDSIQRKEMVVALICAGTGLLATANNLDGNHPQFKGRHVTGYPEVAGLLKLQGQMNYDAGNIHAPYVVVDGNLVTGRDPSSAKLYAETMIQKISINRNNP